MMNYANVFMPAKKRFYENRFFIKSICDSNVAIIFPNMKDLFIDKMSTISSDEFITSLIIFFD